MWLPVAQRELLVASRNPRIYWSRMLAPGIGALLLLLGGAMLETATPASQGKILFRFVALALFLYSAFAGLCFTAEAISSERRDGTLPLLKLTGMRELDLVLGKTFANSLPGIFGFLAGTPILALSLVLGGVTPVEFLRVLVILLGTLFLSLSIGIFASSHALTSGAALKEVLGTLLSVFCLGAIGLLFFGIRTCVLDSKDLAKKAARPEYRWLFIGTMFLVWYIGLPTGSPAALLLNELTGFRQPIPLRLTFPIGVTLLYGMTLYYFFAARPFSNEAAENASNNTPDTEPAPTLLHRRAPIIRGTNPFKWLLAPTDAELILAAGWALVGSALQFLGNSMLYGDMQNPITHLLAWSSFAITTFVFFLFARRAAEFLVYSRRTGMLEVLLVTPLRWSELLLEHRRAFIRYTWFPTSLMMGGEMLGLLAGFRFIPGGKPPEFALIFLVSIVLSYVVCLFATLWCALFFALRTQSSTHAALYSVLLVLVLPAAIGIVFPTEIPNLIPSLYYFMVASAWIYILIAAGLWAGARMRLNSFGPKSPAAICDPSAER